MLRVIGPTLLFLPTLALLMISGAVHADELDMLDASANPAEYFELVQEMESEMGIQRPEVPADLEFRGVDTDESRFGLLFGPWARDTR
ncbi:MAG: hypothetical protein AB7F86_20665, partial [Bdellovibrionales bacterium]